MNEDDNTSLNQIETDKDSSGMIFEVVNNDLQSKNDNIIDSDSDTEYTELNEELAYKYLAEQKGISIDEYKNSLNENDEYVELDEDYALEFIAKSKGITVDDFKNQLTPKEQKKYAPEIEGFQDFYEKTGNKNFNDYLETQKDWNLEPEDVRLKSFIRLSNPSLSEEKVQRLFDRKYSINHLDPEDENDKNSILDIEIDRENDLIKANQFFDERKEKFKGVGGSDEYIPIEYREAKKTLENQIQQEQDYNKLVDEVRKDNISKANQTFNSNSEGFGYEIINEDKSIDKIIYKPENMDEARVWHSDLQNLNNKFFDESGKITNVKEFHAIAEIARIGVQKYTEHIAKTAQANLIERQDKISKNIQPEILKPQYQTGSTGITFTVEK